MTIQYLPYHQVDKQKWDACITAAHDRRIYACSFYLDQMAENWDALILNDYEAVMPLTWNKKMGIAYLYQPAFTQQLGIFGRELITEEMQHAFVTAAQQKFSFAEIYVNFNTGAEHPNYILPLQEPYQSTRKRYKNDLVKNLKHADKFSLIYSEHTAIDTAIDLYKSYYAARTPHVKELQYGQLKKVCISAMEKEWLLIRKVTNQQGVIMAIALLLKDDHRIYNMMSTVTSKGRQCEANHYLFDQLIKEFSGNPLVLDFEGSSIDGIASFYKKFGAVNEPYYFLRYNHLPLPFKYLK